MQHHLSSGCMYQRYKKEQQSWQHICKVAEMVKKQLKSFSNLGHQPLGLYVRFSYGYNFSGELLANETIKDFGI